MALRRLGGIARGTAKRTASATGFGGSASVKQQFRLHGLHEVQKALDSLPDRLRETALKNASAAGARVIRNEAKRLAPVRTGELRNNIVVARTFKQGGKRRKLRGAVVLGLRGQARYMGHLIEFGWSRAAPQPFMRPAMSNKSGEALKVIAEKLAKEIHKQARKLSGWQPVKKVKRLTR